jgi:pimeloyl-ACP methyl ester carboxylesterase
LLRGLGRGSGHWAAFPELLQARLGCGRLLALDLPGNGPLHGLRSPARIEAMTDACRNRLVQLGAEPPYLLVAVSMGAMVAVDWAAREPQALAGCVLINTSLRLFSPWYRRLRPSSYADLVRVALRPMDAPAAEAVILRLTSRNAAAAASVLPAWAALRRTQPVSRSNLLRQLMAASRFQPSTERPAVPLLMLSSDADALVDPDCSGAVAARWDAELAKHPSAGHDLTLDDGPWVVDEISRWLRCHGPVTRPP